MLGFGALGQFALGQGPQGQVTPPPVDAGPTGPGEVGIVESKSVTASGGVVEMKVGLGGGVIESNQPTGTVSIRVI